MRQCDQRPRDRESGGDQPLDHRAGASSSSSRRNNSEPSNRMTPTASSTIGSMRSPNSLLGSKAPITYAFAAPPRPAAERSRGTLSRNAIGPIPPRRRRSMRWRVRRPRSSRAESLDRPGTADARPRFQPMADPPRRRPSLAARARRRRAWGTCGGGRNGIDDGRLATEEAIVQALESPAVERALIRVVESPGTEDAVKRLLASPAVERALVDVLDSQLVDKMVDRLLESDEIQKLIKRIAESPEIRTALTSQGVGLEDLGRQVRGIAHRLDGAAERGAPASCGSTTHRANRQRRAGHPRPWPRDRRRDHQRRVLRDLGRVRLCGLRPVPRFRHQLGAGVAGPRRGS